jgi:hypothetical protein
MIRGCWHPPRSSSFGRGLAGVHWVWTWDLFWGPRMGYRLYQQSIASGVTSRHFVEDSKMFSQVEGCSILTTILWPKPHSSSPILGTTSPTTIESAYIIFASQMKACDIYWLVWGCWFLFVGRVVGKGIISLCRVEFSTLRFSRIIPCRSFPTVPLRLEGGCFPLQDWKVNFL